MTCPTCQREASKVWNCPKCGQFHGCATCQAFHDEVRHGNDEPLSDEELWGDEETSRELFGQHGFGRIQ